MATKAKTTAAAKAAAQTADTKPVAGAETPPAVRHVGTDIAQPPAVPPAGEAKPIDPAPAATEGEQPQGAEMLPGVPPVGTDLDVQGGTGGEVIADPASEIEGEMESRSSGWVITCKRRDRGIWRAGRFWPPEPTPVADGELTAEQFMQLRGETLLHIEKVN